MIQKVDSGVLCGKVPRVMVEDLLSLPLFYPWEYEHNLTMKEMCILNSMVRQCEFKRIFEIGTFNGRTAVNLAFSAVDGAVIYTLDLPNIKEQLRDENFNQLIDAHKELDGRIVQLFGDSMTFDYSPYIGNMDMVLIDANHDYKYVKSDTENAFKMLKPSGRRAILWHDWSVLWPDVVRVVTEYAEQGVPAKQIFATNFAMAYWSE